MKRAKVKRHNRYTLYMTDGERDRLNLVARWYDTTVAGALRQLIDREACLMTVRPIVVADVDVELYDTIERYVRFLTAIFGDRAILHATDVIPTVDEALARLDDAYPVGSRVLRMRYGLNPYDRMMTLEAVAQSLFKSEGRRAVTKERIRQIRVRALRFFWQPSYRNPLLQYVVQDDRR